MPCKKNFTVYPSLYTCLHLPTLVYIRLDSSSDSYTLVYIRLDSSSDSVFLERLFNKIEVLRMPAFLNRKCSKRTYIPLLINLYIS